jgi:predicted nucleotidyltransferase
MILDFETLSEYLDCLNYSFTNPPLIVGGFALKYHNVREIGHDIDIIVSECDWVLLKEKYPNNINLFGGINENEIDATLNIDIDYNNTKIHIDLIKTLWRHNYKELIVGAHKIMLDNIEYKVISLDKLLLLKSFPALLENKNKSFNDLILITKQLCNNKYPNKYPINKYPNK